MNKRTFRTAFLTLALLLALTTIAAADDALSVIRVQVDGWNLLHITEQYAASGYPEKIAAILPKTVTVTLSDGQTARASVAGAWTPDPGNSRWANSVNLSALPAGTADPNGILNEIFVTWKVDDFTGAFSAGSDAKVIGKPGSFSMWRYMSGTDRVELWRVASDGSAALRANQDSEGFSAPDNGVKYEVSAWTADDAGEWFGLYYFSSRSYASYGAYLAGSCAVETENNKVARAAPNGWTLFRLTERYAVPEYLNIVADMLPRTVNVTLLDGQTLELPTRGAWTPDEQNACWTNSVNPSALPDGVTDPDGVLNALSVKWQVDNYTGSFSVSPSAQIVGQEGSFRLGRYMLSTQRVELWQVPADGGPAALRFTQGSDGVSDDGNTFQYAVGAWTAQEAGQWLGLYGFTSGSEMYLAGICAVAPKTYAVTLRPSGGVLQGPETYQTAFVDGSYRLESAPPAPVRNGYAFEGWFTRSTGGEAIAATPQTAFTADITLYAHWSRNAASGPSPDAPTGHALKTVESTGVSGVKTDAAMTASYANSNYGWRMFANLYRNPDGSFVSVDGNAGETVAVTFWNQDFQQTGQKRLTMELPVFGGFFHGETYNYLVFGQRNDDESDETEVFRVVKYDRDFNRVSAASIRDCYTHIPFDAGSCRMAEHGNYLTVHTARERYLTDDGLHHQSQITIVLNTDTMQAENNLGAFQGNHVSHSFNQFVLYDGEKRVLLDHGDAYPRSVVLHQSNGDSYREVNLLDIPGPTGENWTGVGVGGLEQSENYYLAAINTIRQDKVSHGETKGSGHTLDSDERDVMLLSVSKDMDAGSVRQDSLTNYYQTGVTAGVPYLVRTGDNQYVMLWQEFVKNGKDMWGRDAYESKGVRYALLNGNGDLLMEPALLSGARLSAYCQPIADGDSVTWYVDAGGSDDQAGTRTFYRLSFSGNDDTPDAPEIQSVKAADGVVTATLAGTIPAGAQFIAAAYNPDGRFVAAGMTAAVSGQVSVPLTVGDGMTLRAFLLGSDYRPLYSAK